MPLFFCRKCSAMTRGVHDKGSLYHCRYCKSVLFMCPNCKYPSFGIHDGFTMRGYDEYANYFCWWGCGSAYATVDLERVRLPTKQTLAKVRKKDASRMKILYQEGNCTQI